TLNVEVEHPVVAPTALTSRAHGIDCRRAGSVAVGVGVKHRLHNRLQVASGDVLSDAVRNCWNAQQSRPTIRLWNVDPPHRGRKVAPGRQPVPELVEVARKVGLELRNRLSVHASRSLVGLHTLEGFPDFPFGDLERLCLVHRLLPFPVGRWPRLNNAAPSLRPHYRTFLATMGCSAPALCFGTLALAVGAACGFSLHAGGVPEHRFSRSVRKPCRASRRLHAGCRSGSLRHPPNLSRRKGHPPVLASPKPLSTLLRRF